MSTVTKPIALDETLQRVAEALEDMSENMVDFSTASKVYSNVAEMLADETLKNGDNVATRSYYSAGDNGGNNYVISSSHSGIFYLTLDNGLYANLLTEKGVLRAESIGIKAYGASTENPDSSDMTQNVTLFNTAIYNGVYLKFGKGYFYFNDAVQLAHKSTYTIQGTAREVTHLMFPNSDGFYFSDPIYYNYYVIKGMHIHAYGHAIRCAEDCLTILDSHFEWLQLESETGDCFHAPNYNVAKYTSQGGGSTVYDTCVQNCVFDFINVSAPMGAGFCNIMGMYTYYAHMNFVSCKYAFRNCDGIVEQANNLGTQQDYYIYYDKANSYSLRWTFINVNAEALSKAFIYSEPVQAAGAGEDSRKPETANIATIMSLTAINSGWSLRGVDSGHDVYPITAHNISSIFLMNSNNLITPSQYPSNYDTDAVKAQIKFLANPGITSYVGGDDISFIYNNTIHRRFGDNLLRTNLTNGNNGGYNNFVNRNVPSFTEAKIQRLYGGKALDVWDIKTSVITTSTPSPDIDHAFCDVIAVNVDTNADKNWAGFGANYESNYPGRELTILNKSNSLHDLTLGGVNGNRNHNNFSLSKDLNTGVRLAPNEYATFMFANEVEPVNNTVKTIWKLIPDKSRFSNSWYYENDWIYDFIYEMPSHDKLIPFLNGWINASPSSIDITDILPSAASTGSYGYTYALVPCQENDEFTILHSGASGNERRLWAFVESNGHKISASDLNTFEKGKLTITAPAQSAYLIVCTAMKSALWKSN